MCRSQKGESLISSCELQGEAERIIVLGSVHNMSGFFSSTAILILVFSLVMHAPFYGMRNEIG